MNDSPVSRRYVTSIFSREVSAGIFPTGALRHSLVYFWKERQCGACGMYITDNLIKHTRSPNHSVSIGVDERQTTYTFGNSTLMELKDHMMYIHSTRFYFKNEPFVFARHSS